ncbi:manganese catalase family protein [Bacillus salacetis]|uniref:Manganese catalase family protein n=1 Tax=Bacillus salacetis TaxID=2315464 RepID=A0A3A1QRG8_9BACI|nr:manganese catalase family protein [Bacillus salacetis]RIW28048.1 manganese catalase family protein [Bacillus salacetis]
MAFLHRKQLVFDAKPQSSDPLFAKKLQELIGGQYGEMTIFMQYLFQGWNTRGKHEKYKDLIMDTGTEEIGHVELLATMVARLLDGAPVEEQEKAAKDPVIEAVLGGMNPQHAIVAGMGAMPADSNGNRWTADYIIASGNLMADFRANLNAESQGRLQAARLYEMTDDPGVKEMLSYLIARDTMHQNQWIAALQELAEEEGGIIVPTTVKEDKEAEGFSHQLFNYSEGEESREGSWATGASPDGKQFEYVDHPKIVGGPLELKPAPAALHNTPPPKK